MKKKLYSFILVIFCFFLVTGCGEKQNEVTSSDEEILQCMVQELDTFIQKNESELKEISLNDITNETNEITYFKGKYTDSENKYVIYKSNPTYDREIMKSFDLYFAKSFPIYQQFTIKNGIYVFVKSDELDIKNLEEKCIPHSEISGKSLDKETLKKLKNTKKIIIKEGEKQIGTITNENAINSLLNEISNSKQYGDVFLCDGNRFQFEMYEENLELIDILYVWGDGKRFMPKSLQGGCAYYNTPVQVNWKNFIESETDYLFFNLIDYSDGCDSDENLEKIYEDDEMIYFLHCPRSDRVLVNLELSNLTMSLKFALNHGYLTPQSVLEKDINHLITVAIK